MADALESCVEASEAPYSLSPLQEGMLLETLMARGDGVDITQVICTLPEEIDAARMEAAWQQVVDRHDALRSTFRWEGSGSGRQTPRTKVKLPLAFFDKGAEPNQAAILAELLKEDRERGFDPAVAPLLRVTLVRFGTADYRLIWTFHHLIIDARSIALVIKDVFTTYESLVRADVVTLPQPRLYRQFIDWLQNVDEGKAEQFWRKQLKSFNTPTPIPLRERGARTNELVGETEARLSKEVTDRLRATAKAVDVTLNTLVQGAWALLLSRYSGEEDVVFGALRAGRAGSIEGAESMVGVFINTLPVRVRISPEMRLSAWLKQLREQWIALRPYEHTSLAKIQSWSGVPKGRRLFETVLNVQDPSWDAALKAQGGSWARRDFRIINQPGFGLALDVYAGAETILKLVFDPRRYDSAAMRRMVAHVKIILEAIPANLDQCLSGVPLLTAEEEELFRTWNDTAAEIPSLCAHELFEQQARRAPDALAVSTESLQLTYGELNACAEMLAAQLRELGVGPETLVAILMDRSAEFVTSVVAVHKAGGAYVPMDPAYPKERLAYMLQETAAPVLLAQKAHLSKLPATTAKVICVDSDIFRQELSNVTAASRSGPGNPSNLAYVIYTSGSTGTPKGVEIEHRGLTNLICWHRQAYGISSSDRATQIASPAFDAAVWEIWPYLAAGASIHVPDEPTRLSPPKLLGWLERNQITHCFMPTPLAEEALEESWPNATTLKVLLTGGDKLRRAPKRTLPFSLVNHYGPTENSVVTTWSEVTAGDDASAPPIGKPVANTKAYVLDRYMRAVPIGVPGELYVTGTGVARGYRKQPEMTAERFVQFHSGERLYRTGDLVRYREDGNLEFLGRIDEQVKIRGYRIETGELEVWLNRHPAIKQCAVIARESGNETQLVAYLVSSAERPAAEKLREYLAQKVPGYMIPAAFVWLEKLPLTGNGKLDRTALPAPEATRNGVIPPATSTELIISGVWSEVLDKKELSIDTSFFELGGHSLMATRVVSRLESIFGVEIPLTEFFGSPTISGLGRWIEENRTSAATPKMAAIPRRQASQEPVLSFAQERLWFMERLQPGLPFNNIPLAIRIRGRLNVDALRRAIESVVGRHESFRTSFRSVQGRPIANVHPAGNFSLEEVELGAFAPAQREAELARVSNVEARTPFNLEKAPLLRIKLLRLSAEEHALLITTHHIVSDAWSLGIFYNELAALYDSICQGQSAALKPLPIIYGDYAAWQREALQGPLLDQQLSYWQEQLKGASTSLDLPTDRSRPAVQTYRGATRFFALPNTLATSLQALAQRENVTMFMLLMSAFQALMYRYTGQEDVLVGSPVAGRTRVETEGVAGLFLNNLVFRAKFPSDLTFRELLRRTKEAALGAYAHQDLPFEKLVDSLHLQRDLSRSPLFQVMFVLQNTPLQPLNLTGLQLSPLPLDSGTSKYDLTLGLEQRAEGLAGYVEYSTDLFSETSIVRMLGHFQSLLEAIMQQPNERVARLSLLTPAEKQQLLVEWNATKTEFPNKCIHQLFEEQVDRTPHRVAVAFEEEELSYFELNRRANLLAHHLRSMGVEPEARVGICVRRSLEMMIALLAIHKAGGAYVPLDPNYPAERLEFMLQDSAATVLITETNVSTKLPFAAERTVFIDNFFAQSENPECETNPESGATPENPAYVIYTSGSTGKPKGVVVLHRNAANFFTGMDERIGTEPGVWLAVTSISFDISVLELFWTLTRGFKVVIQSDESAFRPSQPQSARSSKRMDFSLFYFASDAGGGRDQYRLLVDGAKFADEHGLSAVWTPERHFHQFGGLFPNASVTSAALAMVTNKVQLRAGSVVLPLHHPIRVAEEWSVVDNLSNGRAAISFASGWHSNDFVLAPGNYVARRQLMYRDIDLFRKLWRGETVVMPGGNGDNVKVKIFPQPVQKEMPAWLTSSGDPETFRMAGELGLNLLTHLSGQSIEQLTEKIGIYRKAWQQSGKPGRGQVALMLHTFVASGMDAAWKKVRKPLWDYLKNYRDLSANVAGRGNKTGGDLETLLNEAVNRYFGMTGLFGSPDHCCKTVQKMRDLGVDEIACLIDFGVDIESVLDSLRCLKTVMERTNRTVFSGARTYSIPEQIHRHSVTHFQCTPSLVSMLAEDDETIGALRRLDKIMLGGEAFPPQLAERLKGKAEILNMYGPTETTIWSTTHRVIGPADSIPIGRPIANTQIYIVDHELQPVPVNVPGELLIGGAGVARGYLNRPELTNERFIADPFSTEAGARLYRTGDLARYLPNGDIEYFGRTDHQVKLRGFRIELGEIEAALRLHPTIREAAVVVREVGVNDKRLFGYAALKAQQQRPAIADLKKFLKEKLPDYMVPSSIMFVDGLPLTPNGKIDRKALPSPEIRRTGSESAFAPAQSELEKSLARVWEQVLQIERVGLNDNFFEIGGHSLLAAQVQARLSELLKVELPIIKLFQYPTISSLAKYLNEDQKEVVSFQKVQDRARRQRQAFAWRKQSTAGSAV